MKDKKNKTVVEYEIEFVVRVKDRIDVPEKRFTDGCPHPSTIADWVIEDLQDDFEDKGYKIIGFNKMSFRNVNKVKE